jgi:hypothetical protein
MFERRDQPEFIEPDRPQALEQAGQHGVQVIAVFDNHPGLRGLKPGLVRLAVSQAHGVELDELQVLTQFVVKLACEDTPLLFLKRDVLL